LDDVRVADFLRHDIASSMSSATGTGGAGLTKTSVDGLPAHSSAEVRDTCDLAGDASGGTLDF
jgi:hypothetical protein